MLFNSYEFILAALPISICVYYFLNKLKYDRMAKVWLVAFSLYFYGFFNWSYLMIICVSIVLNFIVSQGINKIKKWKKHFMILGVACNIGVLFVYKYYDFFIENMNSLLKSSIPLLHLILPLGISFFTFQQISYLVDSYYGKTKEDSFLDYSLFVCFFPQLVAGPIVFREEIMPQFRDKNKNQFSFNKFAHGMYFFTMGLSKKVLLADTLALGVDWGYENIELLSGGSAILVSLLYTFQLYFDFSGYSDMATGIASFFGIELPMNFNSPYKAVSIADFWKRWHISLSKFFSQYVYIPLGGNRNGKRRTLLNLMIVFILSGIWHGAGWTFIVWGILHGIASVIHKCIGKRWEKMPRILTIAITFVFCNFAWIFFRSVCMEDAVLMFKQIFTMGKDYFTISVELVSQFNITEFVYLQDHFEFINQIALRFPSLYMWIVLMISVVIVWMCKNCRERQENRLNIFSALLCPILLFWSLISLSGVSKFLYFNF